MIVFLKMGQNVLNFNCLSPSVISVTTLHRYPMVGNQKHISSMAYRT